MIWLILIPLTIIISFLVMSYNKLIRDKHRVLSGWSDIDVQLKRRHDLIPKLVSAIKQYASYEQATLQAVTELRQQAKKHNAVNQQGKLESQLSSSLFSIYAVAESYPELKTNKSYLDLQQEISLIEKDIHFARRYYNGAVNNLNTRIETFPDLLIANLFSFKAAEYFEMSESQ
ncbi:MAG: LemA family protein [Gammaproteobacteria bacterium]|jgi:LemA protein|nr:LemA family protein [Gammaproteobacteria bacterium]MBT3723363.1 LemA family protein [Gammaproteobacteria bacterium]MBT4193832.1 LemA family protein [Gammaproteobacteria bacterium]MBT4859196.1 LemA family protein [Gammaproteobacteria bacterium]MBT6457769.1 LemA family protein [Gammaproteobacteria bacterium]